jgi:hypothetical protein
VGGEVVYLGHQVLAEASRKRFYGKGTLKQVCEENEIVYSRGRAMVSGYKRLRKVEIARRRAIVDAILEGEPFKPR